MREHTPQSTMMLLNCVDCMVSKYLPLSKFKWFREHSHLPSFLSGIYNFPAVMRIVTWLPIFVSREALYYETGWETLKTRRYVAKMTNILKSTREEYPNICLILSQRNVNMYLHTILVIKKIILFLDVDYNYLETHLYLML